MGCFSGDPVRLFEDILVLRPTVLSGPPIIWDTLMRQYTMLLNSALKDNEGLPEKERVPFEEVRQRTITQFSSVLGGRVKGITVGGAPTSRETVDFLQECFKCRVRESYGATEVGGIYSNGTNPSVVFLSILTFFFFFLLIVFFLIFLFFLFFFFLFGFFSFIPKVRYMKE